ncbi:MAG: polyphosphate:AMP phosphotransferase [Chromatiales bacterium]|nr:polyphosphate:AMP phosphotransferase [Chromatiales bacterium]
MFENAKLGHRLSREEYHARRDALRPALLEAQRAVREKGVPVVVLVSGMDGAGKGQFVNRLGEWLDPRGVRVHAFWDETDEEIQRPRMWRFWRVLPPRGEIAVLFDGWYQWPIEQRFNEGWGDARLSVSLGRIREFERMLIEDGVLIIKLWYHFSKGIQRKRLKQRKHDAHSRWGMLPKKAEFKLRYELFEGIGEQIMRETDLGRAPWHVIEASNARYRNIVGGEAILHAVQHRLANASLSASSEPTATPEAATALTGDDLVELTLLDTLDLTRRIDVDDYDRQMAVLRARINELSWAAYKQQRSSVLVFEGVDAAGKGGAIRRVVETVDARLRRVIRIAAPREFERDFHYLWRFWRYLPRAGRMTVYDRSWYGRVLVERVEGLTPEARWQRAFLEINDFEQQLHDAGAIVMKFWLQISPEEQLARFESRAQTEHKRHKITDEDWRNRDRWDDYRLAANEMFERTSTHHAPWTLVPADDKRYARVEVLTTVCKRLEAAL